MNRTSWRGGALAMLLIGLASWGALALPGFSDRNIAAGNLNPTDTIMVQEIRVTRSTGETVVLSAITLRNTGTADNGEIEKITIRDGGDIIGETENLAGIRGTNGVTIPLGFEMTGTTHSIKVYVTVGSTVGGGETVQLRCLFDYTRNDDPGTSSWITDLTGETIRDGGFDEIDDASPDAGYFNPNDAGIVQVATFADNDANGSPVVWRDGAESIVELENLGTADEDDIDFVSVMLTINGVDYIQTNSWTATGIVKFVQADFIDGGGPPDNEIADNGAVTVTVLATMRGKNSITDGRTIRMKTTLFVLEEGEGADTPSEHEQSVTSQTSQTIRKQGFERIEEESEDLASGTAATDDVVVQTVRAYDDDLNNDRIGAWRIYIRNTGTAEGDEIKKIEVKAGTRTLVELTGAELDTFRTGSWHDFDEHVAEVADDGDQVFKIYYTIGVPDDGHTFRPAVRIEGREPSPGDELADYNFIEGADDYPSDEVTYPNALGLYEPGFEFIENVTPPTGGTCYSSQKLLAQKIRVEDRDEDGDDVTIDPVLILNEGTATGNPDITKIEIWRQDTIDGVETKIGEETDLADIRTSGVRVDITNDSIVQDDPAGSEAYILVYLQIAEPEDVHEGHTIQLVTRIIHTERNGTYDKQADSNQWIIEINHRPVPDFTFEEAENAAASIEPKQDFTYEQTIQFHGEATDPDDDEIAEWHWDFGDGNTSDERNPTHQYPNGGTFDVTLTVTDDRGVSGSVTKTIEVAGPPNQPPSIDDINADPQNPAVKGDVNFTADVTDPDQPEGTAFGYEWDFGDETTSTAAAPQHSYDAAGEYTVTLTVTDAQGATDTATVAVSVGNEVPTIGSIGHTPATKNTGEAVTFEARNVNDPDDDNIVEYRWDFGDGSTATTDGPATEHIYAAPGDYTISLVVEDERGGVSAEKTVDITVQGPTRVVVRAYPNPAAANTTIEFFLPDGATGPLLRIFDLAQHIVLRRELNAGDTEFVWNLRGDNDEPVANGMYFIVITAQSATGRSMTSEVFRLLVAQ